MGKLAVYADPETLPGSDIERIGVLLGLPQAQALTEVSLADIVHSGLKLSAFDTLLRHVGEAQAHSGLVPEATLRRARDRGRLSREISERLYGYARVFDAVSRLYRGDKAAINQFMTSPHPLLDSRTPATLAISSSAGADAVLRLLHRASAGFAV